MHSTDTMKWFITLLLLSMLAACGQKGPLYRSPAMQDNHASKVEHKTD